MDLLWGGRWNFFEIVEPSLELLLNSYTFDRDDKLDQRYFSTDLSSKCLEFFNNDLT